MASTPQFPLGTVLFPSMVLPLHVFEPRYRSLVADVLDGDAMFGVPLIERGNEVGGGDQRTDYGTMARIAEAEQFDDGRWAVVAVGVERYRVVEWLDDDPYPRAVIELWPDEAPSVDVGTLLSDVSAKFKRCMGLAAESGLNVGPLPPEIDDVVLRSFHMSALAPVGPLDKQTLLGAPDPVRRLELLDGMLDETIELLVLELGST